MNFIRVFFIHHYTHRVVIFHYTFIKDYLMSHMFTTTAIFDFQRNQKP